MGVAYNVITGDSGTTTTSISVRENNESITVFSASATEQDKNILSVEYEIGVNFRTNFAFFQLEYNRSVSLFSTPLSGDYKFINLNNSPDISGFFQSNLNYRSVSLTFAPKKGWLKRKPKKQ